MRKHQNKRRMKMTQVTVNVPTVTPNAMTNVLGVVGGIGVLLQAYVKTGGSISLETVAIAVFVALVCFFIGKADPALEAKMVDTISTVVDSTIESKLPTVLTQLNTVNALEVAAAQANLGA
jgi:hypothetical protein